MMPRTDLRAALVLSNLSEIFAMTEKSFAQGLRNPKFEKRFEGAGDGEALAACRKWLADHMFVTGPDDIRGKYIGVMYGVESVKKWSAMDSEEQNDLHGMIFADSGSFRRGPVTFLLRSNVPLDVVSAFRAEIADPADALAQKHVEGAPA